MMNTLISHIARFADVSNLLGQSCDLHGGDFLHFPKWYEYLGKGMYDANGRCTPVVHSLSDIWLVVAAVIDILVRIAAIAAVIAIIYGAFQYVTSQGDPEPTAKAKGTLVNAMVGLAISVMAAAIISFIAGSFN